MTAHELHEAHGAHLGSQLIVFGRAGDLFGRRGLAGSEWQLVAARAAQGVGAAMVSPTARPPRHRRGGKCEWTRH